VGTGKTKRLRRAVRKEKSVIKVEGLDEFFRYAKSQTLWRRIVFAVRVIIGRL
jgi:hypothetical protein